MNVKSMLYIALFATLVIIGAFLRIPIPLYPVPFSLQTLFVMLAGLLLTRKEAMYSLLVYMLLGLTGLPIFSGGGGPGYVLQPTFGYILSFIFAAPICGAIASKFSFSKAGILIACFTAGVLINLIGVLYMFFVLRALTGNVVTLEKAGYLLFIFLPIEFVKSLICSLVAGNIKKATDRFRSFQRQN